MRKQAVLSVFIIIIFALVLCGTAVAADTSGTSNSVTPTISEDSSTQTPEASPINQATSTETKTQTATTKNEANTTNAKSTNTCPVDPIISGVVLDCKNHKPFPGVTIKVNSLNGDLLASAITDENGSYQAAFLSSENIFQVTASYPGHHPASQEVNVKPSSDPNDPNLYGTANFELGYIYVGPTRPYTTIQAGIDAALPGDTILVDPGTYKETLQDITKPLTLKSIAGAATTIIQGVNRGYTIFIRDTHDVTIDGFTITNTDWMGGSDPSGIVVEAYNGPASDVYNIVITNNIIHDVCSPTNQVVFGAVGVNIGPSNGVEVFKNTIYNIRQGNPSSSPWWANGISVWGSDANNMANNVNIHDNNIYDISSLTQYNAGISLQQFFSNVNIKNNVIKDTAQYGIQEIGDALNPVNIEGNQISGNSIASIFLNSLYQDLITNNQLTGSQRGVQVEDGSPHITSNTITGNTDGVYINGGTPSIISNNIINNQDDGIHLENGYPVIHFNRILGNGGYGLNLNFEGAKADAINNWWGHNSAPTQGPGTPKDYNVIYTGQATLNPWLVLGITAVPGSIYNGQTSTITADLNHNWDGGSTYSDTSLLGHVPDGILVTFSFNPALGTLSPPPGTSIPTINGIATSVFTDSAVGTAHFYTSADQQMDQHFASNTAKTPADVLIRGLANMTVEKTSNSPVNVGRIGVFTITLYNNGPDSATGVRVTDLLPKGFTAGKPSQGSYNGVIWDVGTLAKGASATLTLSGLITSTMAGKTIQNTATETQNEHSNLPKTATASIYVPEAVMDITKTASNSRPRVNDTVIFTVIVQNHGPDTAVDVNVLDQMPAGLNFVSYTTNSGSYDPTTGIWHIGNLPVGAVATITITATVTRTGSITNKVTITSITYDPNTTASVTIIATPDVPVGPSANAATVPMQPTGAPITVLALAIIMVLFGVLTSKRR